MTGESSPDQPAPAYIPQVMGGILGCIADGPISLVMHAHPCWGLKIPSDLSQNLGRVLQPNISRSVALQPEGIA